MELTDNGLSDLAGRVADLAAQLALAHAEIEQLKIAVESRGRIGAAVGIIMATHRLTRADAFDLLRATSQNDNRKLRDVADEITESGLVPTLPSGREARVRLPRQRGRDAVGHPRDGSTLP